MRGIESAREDGWPTVTVVFLAYNRREELRVSLTKTLGELEYDHDRLDVIVVDNASTDGTTEMLARDFEGVRVIARPSNNGVSGWNDGFAIASGDYVLVLDDDCYLPPEGLRRAVAEAREQSADLVSFAVRSSQEQSYRFDLVEYRTGLFSFWGCAVLMRREVLSALDGYDPEIFVWANELEFMLRFFDRGFRHLHLPEVVAVHAKAPTVWGGGTSFPERPYRINYHNFGYIAAKLLRPRDALEALIALLMQNVRDGMRMDSVAYRALPGTVRGFARGLLHRRAVRAEVSRAYRHNFETFASPWWIARPLPEIARSGFRKGGPNSRHDDWMAERARFYPEQRGVLEL